MPNLVLVRHGKSEWNKLGLWTGWTDVELAAEGFEESRRTAKALREIEFHEVHVAAQKRSHQTLVTILEELGLNLPIRAHPALNERHYGIYTGKNKWEVKALVGEGEFQRIRRGWDTPIPEGESLKQVHARVVPYYETIILPSLRENKNILVVSSGNSLRALIKHLEELSDEAIADVEMGIAEAVCYELDPAGKILNKEIRSVNEQRGKI